MAWRVLCDRCGWKFWNNQLRKEWTGLMTCSGPGTNQCWEPRNPQDFVKGKADKQAPPWVRPEPEDTFVLEFYRREADSPTLADSRPQWIYREDGLPYVRES